MELYLFGKSKDRQVVRGLQALYGVYEQYQHAYAKDPSDQR